MQNTQEEKWRSRKEAEKQRSKEREIQGRSTQWKQIWLVVSSPLKNMKVNWDDDIPNLYLKKCKNEIYVPVTTNQQ